MPTTVRSRQQGSDGDVRPNTPQNRDSEHPGRVHSLLEELRLVKQEILVLKGYIANEDGKEAGPSTQVLLIPRPSSRQLRAGLSQSMRLDLNNPVDKLKYEKARTVIRSVVHVVGLDPSVADFRDQSLDKKARLVELSCDILGWLRRYEQAWPVHEFARRHLINVRATLRKGGTCDHDPASLDYENESVSPRQDSWDIDFEPSNSSGSTRRRSRRRSKSHPGLPSWSETEPSPTLSSPATTPASPPHRRHQSPQSHLPSKPDEGVILPQVDATCRLSDIIPPSQTAGQHRKRAASEGASGSTYLDASGTEREAKKQRHNS